jgi:hypothetical protein
MGDQSRYLGVTKVALTSTPAKLFSNSGSTARKGWYHIINLGPNTVWILNSSTGLAADGYPVPPQNLTNGVSGEKIIENHSGEIWARCANAETADVRTMTQQD